jgi:hypothetical protein
LTRKVVSQNVKIIYDGNDYESEKISYSEQEQTLDIPFKVE